MWTIGTRVQVISFATGLGSGPIGTITDEVEYGVYIVKTHDGSETEITGDRLTNKFNPND